LAEAAHARGCSSFARSGFDEQARRGPPMMVRRGSEVLLPSSAAPSGRGVS
jgi:hypothetical protein